MIYLASKSPRRQELLGQIDVRFECLAVDVPEIRAAEEGPSDYVARVARDKAFAGQALVEGRGRAVLAADTEVVLDDRVFGKPQSELIAQEMIQRLAGRTHQVLTAVVVLRGREVSAAMSTTEVSFSSMTGQEVEAYCATGEWEGKAGGYAVQGRAAAYIHRLSGSYSGVMGLPLYETRVLLNGASI